MAKKRVTRKELLKEPDEFLTLSGKIIGWAKLNPKPLTYGAGAILVLILIVTGYGYYQNNRAEVSTELLGQSLSQYYQLAAEGDAVQALNDVGPDFEKLTDKFSGQPAGRLGCLYFAHFNLKGQNPQKAAELYQKALKYFGDDPALTPIILNGLATAYLESGQASQAADTYERLLSLEASAFKDVALFHLGRLYAENDQPEKSREMFERLAMDYPDSSYARLAREKAAG